MRRIEVWAALQAPAAIVQLTIDARRSPHLLGYKLHFVFQGLARDAVRLQRQSPFDDLLQWGSAL
jgi:hypothetical protein